MRIIVLVLSILFCVDMHAQISRNVELLDLWTDLSLPINNDNTRFNDCWGFEYQGKEYAVVGSTLGTHIFLITEDDKLQLVDFVEGESNHTLTSNNIHRDFKTYRNYLYGVCDEGASTLQVMDLQYLPDSVSLVYNSNAGLIRCHNLYIDTTMARMYACGVTTQTMQIPMRVFSLDDPINPQNIFDLNTVAYVHDAYVRNDTAYLNCPFNGLYIYKFNQGLSPVLLGYLDNYPELGYNHSGWLSENGKYYVFADETTGKKMKLCDVSEPTDIDILDLFLTESDNQTIAHNLMWKDDFIYVSHYYEGLQVYDARDKNNVKRVAWWDTHEEDSNPYQGAWGVYCFLNEGKVLLSDRSDGLYLFRVHLPPRINAEIEYGIYPNPSNGETVFYYTNETDLNYKFSVFDVTGRIVFQAENIPNHYLRFNTTLWTAGTYIYQWEGMDNDIRFTGKFQVIR